MLWLLLKDLKILKRSPLLVALLVLYPVIVAVLIGFALSRGPDKPEVAFYNGVPSGQSQFELGSTKIDLSDQADTLFEAVDPVRVNSPEEARRLVRSGDVLGAIIIPEDITQKLRSGIASGTIEVLYNAEDPAKRQYVENTVRSQVQAANAALTKRIAKEARVAARAHQRRRPVPLPGQRGRRPGPEPLGGDPARGARRPSARARCARGWTR